MHIMDTLLRWGLTLLMAAKAWLGALWNRVSRKFPTVAQRPATENSRGDVPGWVLITLMSAVLVAGLLAIAGPALERLFNQAMDQVQP